MNLVSRVGGIDQLSSSPGRSCASDSDCSAFNDGSECARRQQFPSLVISAANIPSVQVVTNVTGNGTCGMCDQ